MPSPKPHATKSRDSATIAPARIASPLVASRRGAEVKANTPATARGIASRKPASAAEGNGTLSPRPTSIQDQMASPSAQLSAERENRNHATRGRPEFR